MNRFDNLQRKRLANFFDRISLMAAGALIFGQFIPGQEVDWLVVLLGLFVIFIFMFISVIFSRE